MLAFGSKYIPIFQNFRQDFLLDFLQIWPIFRHLGGVQNGPMFTFLYLKSIHLSGTFPYILYMWNPPPLGPSWSGTQIIMIPPINGMHRYKKSVEKGHLSFWEGNLSWTHTRVKGHPAGAPWSRVPAGLPTLSP